MKPFVLNRYGRMVFPSNFFPELDFSVFETLEQFAAVIKRDFEENAPTETDIVACVDPPRVCPLRRGQCATGARPVGAPPPASATPSSCRSTSPGTRSSCRAP